MELLLQQEPAQTLNFMIAGFVVIFGIMGLYVVSLIIRRRNLEQDVEMLEDLQTSKDRD